MIPSIAGVMTSIRGSESQKSSSVIPTDERDQSLPYETMVYLLIGFHTLQTHKRPIFNRTEVEVFADPEFIVCKYSMIDSINAKPYSKRVKRVDRNTSFRGKCPGETSR